MSNIDRAAKVVKAAILKDPGTARSIAQALADADLLMPDLPKPDGIVPISDGTETPYGTGQTIAHWTTGEDHYAGGAGSVVFLSADEQWEIPAKEARKKALFLLAAADYAERN